MTTATIRESREPAARPSEGALARLWQNAHVLTEGLVTQDGSRFRVIYPGRRNQGAGPDFRDAVFASETSELLCGDVELHLNARDWYSHRHHVDPGYNGVVLHVVLHPNGEATSIQQSRTCIPVAALAGEQGLVESPAAPDVVGLSWVHGEGQRNLGELLDSAGDQRFYAKSRGFALELQKADPEETLYGALLEALGYAANRRPFRELARAVPMSMMSTLRSEPASTRALAVRAVLLNAAGLLGHLESREEARELAGMLKHLPRTRTVPAGSWRLSGARPSNHPVSRIAGAAVLVERFIDKGLLHGLEEEVRVSAAGDITDRLTARPFIGRGRARDMVVNVVLPFMHSRAGTMRDWALRTRCVELFQGFPKLEENGLTREMRRLLDLDSRGVEVVGARRQQGLIQLYKAMRGSGRRHVESAT